MKALTCAATRRRLDAFHDRELSIADQIAVGAHLDWCDDCAAVSADMRSVAAILRSTAPGRSALSHEDAVGFGSAIVSRAQAERDASMATSLRVMFDDMHRVYAGLCATVAATICLVLMVGMMRAAAETRPDSLASILEVMATSFECETSEVSDALACRARWVERFQRASESAEQDAVFTLDAIVIHHQGRLANLAVLRTSRLDASGQAEAIEELLDTVSRARSTTQPTDVSGIIVRMVARETVRATKPVPIDLTLPAPKSSISDVRRAARGVTA